MKAAAASDIAVSKTAAPVKSKPVANSTVQPVNANWQLLALGAQAKLAVSAPDDPAEQEADRVADAVVDGLAAPRIANGAMPTALAFKCAACEVEEESRDKNVIARKATTAESATPASALPSALGLAGGGTPLPQRTRNAFEASFGVDFSNVRIHDDGAAHDAARTFNARAFTYGSDIAFSYGQFQPETQAGRHLLAHELTHVVQQGGSGARVQRSPEDVQRIIADQDSRGVVSLPQADINAASPAQRAGMVRILTDLTWTREEDELATMRLIEANHGSNAVLQILDEVRYLDLVVESVDREDLNQRLRTLIATYRGERSVEDEEPGDAELQRAIDSGQASEIMRIRDFVNASSVQRLAALQIMIALTWSNTAEETKMIEILHSAGSTLAGLMDRVKALGLKERLFDHIDDADNKARFSTLLHTLHDPELEADLVAFNQGWLDSLLSGIGGGLAMGWEWVQDQGPVGVISSMLQPVIHPIDTITGLVLQGETVFRTVDFTSLEWWSRLTTLLRDIAGTVGMWLLTLSAILGAVGAVLGLFAGITIETVVGTIAFGAASATVLAWATTVFGWSTVAGLIFVGLAAIRLILDSFSAGSATTHREHERATERLAEDSVLAAITGALALILRGFRLGLGWIRGAAEPVNIEGGDLSGADRGVRTNNTSINEEAGTIRSNGRGSGGGSTRDGNVVYPDRFHPNRNPGGPYRNRPTASSQPMFGDDGSALQVEPALEPELEPEIEPEIAPEELPAEAPTGETPTGETPTTTNPQPNTGTGVLPTTGLSPAPHTDSDEEEEEECEPCGDDNPLPTQVTFTPASGPRGGEIFAAPLTRRAGNTHGSAPDIPSLWPTLWSCIVSQHGSFRWVHAHLLHGETSGAGARNLHGPGNRKENIILSDKTLNGGMSRLVEQPALTLVYDQRCTLWYRVRVNHMSGAGAVPYFAESVFMDYGYYDRCTGEQGPSLIGGGITIQNNPARVPPTCADPNAPPPGP